MRKIVGALIAALIMGFMVLVPAHAASAAQDTLSVAEVTAQLNARCHPTQCSYHCKRTMIHDEGIFNDNSFGRDDWFIRVTHVYDFCTRTRGPDYVVPVATVGYYDFEGGSMGCNKLGGGNLKHVRINPYFHSMNKVTKNRKTFDPGFFDIPCDTDGHRSVRQSYLVIHEIPWWYKTAPRFADGFDIQKNFSNDDVHGRFLGAFEKVKM